MCMCSIFIFAVLHAKVKTNCSYKNDLLLWLTLYSIIFNGVICSAIYLFAMNADYKLDLNTFFSLTTFLLLFISPMASAIRSSYLNNKTMLRKMRFSMSTVSGIDDSLWYKDGLRFSCTLCGNCCSGSSGSVTFTEEEGFAIAHKLKIDVSQFYQRYTRLKGRGGRKYAELKEVKGPNGYDCIFLDRKSLTGKAICSLYEVRPLQCKTWPFWSEILDSKETWDDSKKGKDKCPGLDTGNRIYAVDEIVQLRNDTDDIVIPLWSQILESSITRKKEDCENDEK